MEKGRIGLGLVKEFDRKSYCLELFEFHNWRQRRIVELMNSFDPAYFTKQINGSFSSLFIVLEHLIWAEKVWFSRMDGTGVAVMKSNQSVADLLQEWTLVTHKWTELVNSKGEEGFEEIVTYHTTKGVKHDDRFFEIVIHLIDHSTYHIGQMMNAVRSLGLEPVPTNFIHFLRDKKN